MYLALFSICLRCELNPARHQLGRCTGHDARVPPTCLQTFSFRSGLRSTATGSGAQPARDPQDKGTSLVAALEGVEAFARYTKPHRGTTSKGGRKINQK